MPAPVSKRPIPHSAPRASRGRRRARGRGSASGSRDPSETAAGDAHDEAARARGHEQERRGCEHCAPTLSEATDESVSVPIGRPRRLPSRGTATVAGAGEASLRCARRSRAMPLRLRRSRAACRVGGRRVPRGAHGGRGAVRRRGLRGRGARRRRRRAPCAVDLALAAAVCCIRLRRRVRRLRCQGCVGRRSRRLGSGGRASPGPRATTPSSAPPRSAAMPGRAARPVDRRAWYGSGPGGTGERGNERRSARCDERGPSSLRSPQRRRPRGHPSLPHTR